MVLDQTPPLGRLLLWLEGLYMPPSLLQAALWGGAQCVFRILVAVWLA